MASDSDAPSLPSAAGDPRSFEAPGHDAGRSRRVSDIGVGGTGDDVVGGGGGAAGGALVEHSSTASAGRARTPAGSSANPIDIQHLRMVQRFKKRAARRATREAEGEAPESDSDGDSVSTAGADGSGTGMRRMTFYSSDDEEAADQQKRWTLQTGDIVLCNPEGEGPWGAPGLFHARVVKIPPAEEGDGGSSLRERLDGSAILLSNDSILCSPDKAVLVLRFNEDARTLEDVTGIPRALWEMELAPGHIGTYHSPRDSAKQAFSGALRMGLGKEFDVAAIDGALEAALDGLKKLIVQNMNRPPEKSPPLSPIVPNGPPYLGEGNKENNGASPSKRRAASAAGLNALADASARVGGGGGSPRRTAPSSGGRARPGQSTANAGGGLEEGLLGVGENDPLAPANSSSGETGHPPGEEGQKQPAQPSQQDELGMVVIDAVPPQPVYPARAPTIDSTGLKDKVIPANLRSDGKAKGHVKCAEIVQRERARGDAAVAECNRQNALAVSFHKTISDYSKASHAFMKRQQSKLTAEARRNVKLTTEKQQLAANVKAMTASLKDLRASLQKKKLAQDSEAQQKLTVVEAELNRLKIKSAAKLKETKAASDAELKRQKEELTYRINTENDKVTDRDQRLKDKQKDVDSARKEKEALSKSLEAVRKKLESEQKKSSKLAEEVARLKSDLPAGNGKRKAGEIDVSDRIQLEQLKHRNRLEAQQAKVSLSGAAAQQRSALSSQQRNSQMQALAPLISTMASGGGRQGGGGGTWNASTLISGMRDAQQHQQPPNQDSRLDNMEHLLQRLVAQQQGGPAQNLFSSNVNVGGSANSNVFNPNNYTNDFGSVTAGNGNMMGVMGSGGAGSSLNSNGLNGAGAGSSGMGLLNGTGSNGTGMGLTGMGLLNSAGMNNGTGVGSSGMDFTGMGMGFSNTGLNSMDLSGLDMTGMGNPANLSNLGAGSFDANYQNGQQQQQPILQQQGQQQQHGQPPAAGQQWSILQQPGHQLQHGQPAAAGQILQQGQQQPPPQQQQQQHGQPPAAGQQQPNLQQGQQQDGLGLNGLGMNDQDELADLLLQDEELLGLPDNNLGQ